MATAILYKDSNIVDIIEFDEPDIDCSNCQHSSKCCIVFHVPLTPYESQFMPLDAKKWERKIAELAKKDNGECIFLKNGRCLIWNQRPLACREYSCKGDERIIQFLSA
jgi:Fe-S-cluster containining protein